MITFVEGILEEKNPSLAVINAQGVGYEIAISLNTYEALGALRDTIRLHTYHYLRENIEQLFGFATREERSFFILLTGVSGIGPASALIILSSMPLTALYQAIGSGDAKTLSSIKGIGKKTAERLIVDLKDKLGHYATAAQTTDIPSSQVLSDATRALITLGYTNSEALAAVTKALKAQPEASLDQIIRLAIDR